MRRIYLCSLFIASSVLAQTNSSSSCEKLKDLPLPHAEITSATAVPEGPLAAPNAPGHSIQVPAHCAVKLISRPTGDSEIGIEVWLPMQGWNTKYRQVGNGGWAGGIPTADLADSVNRGYAAAGTDDGHSGQAGAIWAIGHPEKLIDFGYRALHETRIAAQAIVVAFYGHEPSKAYFTGCSDGGREALMVAQRFPEDFNGIVAGAPANNWSHLFAGFVWNEQALLKTPQSAIPPTKLAAIEQAALNSCDAQDGVKDGLIEDPRVCHFDPAVLACKEGEDDPDCLTAPQLEALKQIYAGPKNPRTGKQIFPGYPPGTENNPFGWSAWITPKDPSAAVQFMFGNTYFGQAVLEQTDWSFRKLNFDSDVAFADRKAGVVVDSTNPDLRTFRDHGGKLIQYHGWGDAAIAAQSSIDYYEGVKSFMTTYPDARDKTPGPVDSFYRLFMVPGMGHCGGGAGPNSFGQTAGFNPAAPPEPDHDVVIALERWVEKGIAPDKLIGTGKNLTRPLCVYPETAHYKGSGDPSEAANFTCIAAQP
jgi:feruloyl esterase